jgi:glycosyltransferase involved in cell wall biosynthesis
MQRNAGPARARNAGVAGSSAEYLAFLDADDRWMPGFLDRMVCVLDSYPECVMVYSNLAVLDSEGNALGTSLIGPEFDHAPSMDEILSRMWPIMPSGALIRRTAFERCGGFCAEFKHAGYEDEFLWLRLREQGPFTYIPENLAAWRFSMFPRPIKRKPAGLDRHTFARLVRERYKIEPEKLVGARLRASRSMLGYMGLMALQRGDRTSARRAFANAIRIDPCRLKNHLRFIKTFLPIGVARSLSGRTRLVPPSPETLDGDHESAH